MNKNKLCASRSVSRVLYGLDPRSVPRRGDHSSGVPVTWVTSTLPTRTIGLETLPVTCATHCPYSVLLPMGFTYATPIAARAVGSYPTISPLPLLVESNGGLFSVALSLEFSLTSRPPRPDVIRHCGSMEPGLSSTAVFQLTQQRSPDRLAGEGVLGVGDGVKEKGLPGRLDLQHLNYHHGPALNYIASRGYL